MDCSERPTLIVYVSGMGQSGLHILLYSGFQGLYVALLNGVGKEAVVLMRPDALEAAPIVDTVNF